MLGKGKREKKGGRGSEMRMMWICVRYLPYF